MEQTVLAAISPPLGLEEAFLSSAPRRTSALVIQVYSGTRVHTAVYSCKHAELHGHMIKSSLHDSMHAQQRRLLQSTAHLARDIRLVQPYAEIVATLELSHDLCMIVQIEVCTTNESYAVSRV